MKFGVFILAIMSIFLSSSGQILLKMGMSSGAVRTALQSGFGSRIIWAIATNLGVVAGLSVFGLSVILWLFVLYRADLSLAYPFMALGIVVTTIAGRLMFGETISILRIAGLVVIVGGVVMVAISDTGNRVYFDPAPPAAPKDAIE